MSKDIVHDAAKIVDHNRYTVLAIAVVLALTWWVAGCSSKTLSLVPDKAARGVKVTRPELQAELTTLYAELESQVASIEARAGAAVADLDKQDTLKRNVAEAIPALAVAVGAPPSIISMLPLLLGAGGFAAAGGLKLDNMKKDKVITTLKTESKTNEAVVG